jgi:beta-lactamase superfamily II metal-dependent hydrolase
MRRHPSSFAEWTSPDWVIISGDRRSNRPEVSDAYADRGATVLNTSRAGAVTATINQDGVRVTTQRGGDEIVAR